MVNNQACQTRSCRISVQVAPSEGAIEAGRSVKTEFKLRKNWRSTIESARTSMRKCVPSDCYSYLSLALCPSVDQAVCFRPARCSNTTCNGDDDDDDHGHDDGMVRSVCYSSTSVSSLRTCTHTPEADREKYKTWRSDAGRQCISYSLKIKYRHSSGTFQANGRWQCQWCWKIGWTRAEWFAMCAG